MTTTRIVVGVDGSAPSRQALRWAAWPQDWDPPREARRLLTETVAETFGGRPPVPTETLVREGNAARILIQEAHHASMVVVGSRGHGAVAGVLLGSVSAKVAEHAACPVLVVHGDQLPQIPRRKEETSSVG